eukprot:5391343-Pleurochrysis_carterae.AAC.2
MDAVALTHAFMLARRIAYTGAHIATRVRTSTAWQKFVRNIIGRPPTTLRRRMHARSPAHVRKRTLTHARARVHSRTHTRSRALLRAAPDSTQAALSLLLP